MNSFRLLSANYSLTLFKFAENPAQSASRAAKYSRYSLARVHLQVSTSIKNLTQK